MSLPLPPLDPSPSLSSIEVLRRVDLGDGRVVATVRVGAIRLGSIFIVEGRVSWPRTARGFEIICIEDAALRERIEAELLAGPQQGEPAKPLVIDLHGIPPKDFARATECGGTLKRFAEFCTKHDAQKIAKAFFPKETAALRQHAGIVRPWLAAFAAEIAQRETEGGQP